MTDERAVTELAWRWEWVPSVQAGDRAREAWIRHLVALTEEWTRDDLAAVRAAWAADAGTEFPFTAEVVARGIAGQLLEQADRLPPRSRLAWGTAFVDGALRWGPVPVVVEFRRPRDEDPVYLMAAVGAKGRDGDAREPVIEYVTTAGGDGVRVFAYARDERGTAYGRLDAALRLDLPAVDAAAAVSVDVLLTTRVFDLGLMAVIGPGVEQLMHKVAADSTPGARGERPRLRFAATAGAAS